MPLLVDLFKSPELHLLKSKVFEIFDQEYNVPDISPGKEAWAKKRCLPKVFENDRVQKLKFNYHNTIIIDTEPDNCVDHVENSLIVPAYT